MERKLRQRAAEYDIVHSHGIWTALSRVANLWRVQANGPVVLAPHGSLDPWALQRSRLKKRLALSLYERRNLHQAACLHALSTREAEGCRGYGLKQPVAIIPNGIDVAWLETDGDARAFRSKYDIPETTRIALFLGRITPIKGLPTLLRAIAECKNDFENWRLVIAGVDEFGHQQEIATLREQLGLGSAIQFVGPLYNQDKRNAYAAADLFVLPSHSEGSPLVILEALGAGVPVLATKASPWPELTERTCGWWADISVEAIGPALFDAICKPPLDLKDMGLRGKQLVAEKYTWHQIAQQTLALYGWLVSGGTQPGFVITE